MEIILFKQRDYGLVTHYCGYCTDRDRCRDLLQQEI